MVCWTPGLVTLLLDGLLGKDGHGNTYEKFCLVMAECNSLVNPVIYALRDDEMRRTFRWILCCLCGRSERRGASPLAFSHTAAPPQVGHHPAGRGPPAESLPVWRWIWGESGFLSAGNCQLCPEVGGVCGQIGR